ncbi:MAG: hypothetical protein EZS28_002831 [Streblomastix strix]|uniref:Uncharacterized protein n=1 Tax=Streblomastix strix TaxID=222440 RepID=A0A5J4X347_9EUKA|nr:MAG: hypothetical protein EZS28_002831 [Streblomastix strix]
MPFTCGQKVSIELDMTSTPRRATFFVDGKVQQNTVTDLPKAIRFFAFIQKAGSSFQITKTIAIDLDSIISQRSMQTPLNYNGQTAQSPHSNPNQQHGQGYIQIQSHQMVPEESVQDSIRSPPADQPD